MKIEGEHIYLRTPKRSDIEVLFQWENNPEIQDFNLYNKTYSKEEIQDFVNGNHDLASEKQLRLMICENESETILGTLDLFNYDKDEEFVGIGIILFTKQERHKGKGTNAMSLLIEFLKHKTNIKTLYCNIDPRNENSLAFFNKLGFSPIENITSKALHDVGIPGLIFYTLVIQ